MLALFVCALVMVDVAILIGYTLQTLVEGLRGNLEAKLTVHAENPSDILGVGTTLACSVHIGFNSLPTIYIGDQSFSV